MAGIVVSLDLFPLVRITNQHAALDSDYTTMLAAISRLIDARDRFVVLTDGPGGALPGPSQRKVIADWFPTVRGRMEKVSVGCAMVMTSALQRGSITALNWLARPDVPLAAFEDEGEALRWCVAQLEKNGVAVPSQLTREVGRRAVAGR